MADTKITALTALTAADPANDVLPIVDVSDTTMAASGTTKKISVNNILGAGGTATLASATITGDLTVDTSTLKVDSTNNRVGIGTASPSYILDILGASPRLHIRDNGTGSSLLDIENGAGTFYVGRENSTGSGGLSGVPYAGILYLQGAYPIICGTNFTERYRIASDGVATWSNVGGVAGTAMTLNATGLGVGASPSYQLHVSKSQASATTLFVDNQQNNAAASSDLWLSAYGGQWKLSVPHSATFVNPLIFKFGSTEMMRIDSSGNVGIGVTPSAWGAAFKPVQIGSGTVSSAFIGQTNTPVARIMTNSYFDGTNFVKVQNNTAGMYVLSLNQHEWHNATTGTGNITWTQAMTLDASGRLVLGTTGAYNSARFTVQAAGGAGGIATAIQNDDDSYYAINFRNSSGVSCGSISCLTSSTAFNTSSDYRLKESVQPIIGALSRISALKPSIYKWKVDGSSGEGFLAHELAAVVPFAVTGEKDAVNEDGSIKPQQVDLSKIVPVLVAAIQELTARVQTLETR